MMQLLVSSFAFSEPVQKKDITNIEQTSLSCFSIGDPNSKNVESCLINSNKIIKSLINKKLLSLNEADRLYVLNNHGLDFEVQKDDCRNFSGKNIKLECIMRANLSYLNFLTSRYGGK